MPVRVGTTTMRQWPVSATKRSPPASSAIPPGSAPSIETIYDESTAPGLFQPGAPGQFSNPTFIHSEATAAIDWRPSAGYARKGGYYGVPYPGDK